MIQTRNMNPVERRKKFRLSRRSATQTMVAQGIIGWPRVVLG
jgi:hypothetical protein